MSRKYLVFLSIQFIVIAMLFVYSFYQQALAQAARANAADSEALAKELKEVRAELENARKQLENCK